MNFSLTFENDQNQTDVSKSNKSLLPVIFKDIGQGHSVYDSDGDLTYYPGLDCCRGDPSCKRKEKEERNDNEYVDNCGN